MADTLLERLAVRPRSNFSFQRLSTNDTLGWEKEAAKAELLTLLPKIDALQQKLASESRRSVLVILQAMDAAGKDGTIRNVFGPLNAIGVRVSNFKAPAGEELEHDYLWRVHAHTPARGEIGVWNRSHYEDVLVVRVKSIVPKERWERRYRHIREFERMLGDEGTRVVKINLHISSDEQRERLQARIDDPTKRWKFRMGDLEDRALWPEFMKAYEAAISETSTDDAPWYVVPADRKWVRNLAVAHILLHVLEEMDPQLPPDDPQIAGLVVA
jgi:PPK2 family polyphosphate:nucleotide phosphotransferase